MNNIRYPQSWLFLTSQNISRISKRYWNSER